MEYSFELAKNIGTLLGTASVVGYACGYLALRARSFALGTDPAFKLVDQIYVFAGVRFLVITLIVALLLSPVVLVVRSVALWLTRSLPEHLIAPVQWIALIMVATMTLVSMGILRASGLLLRDPLPSAGLESAVLGGSVGLRLGLTFASVLLAVLSALWLLNRAQSGQGALVTILAVVVALQAFLLPVYHGALFADRRVRVLSQLPPALSGLVMPVAIVDRTADQATLFGLDPSGRRGLATVEFKALDGIPILAVTSLRDFLDQVSDRRDAASGGWMQGVLVADASGAVGGGDVADDRTKFANGFYGALASYFDMVLDSIGSLGGGSTDGGELWTADLDPEGRPSELRRVGDLDDVSWPVIGADGTSYLALRGGKVVRLDADGAVVAVLAEVDDWRKLFGERSDGSILGLIRRDGEMRPALLVADGTVEVGPAPSTDEEKRALARLTQDARAYSDGRVMTVDRSARGGRGFDVFLKAQGSVVNLTDCGDDYCGQASLAPGKRRLVFVRTPPF
ncbi:hypothetical protein [Rhizobium sp. BK251]|uniref:hypothetical protein n=1 Tax=Rhizobium sp. BK251 TaxID=2512125 RepID=UPI001042EAC0|nr:hypothetical protein [Rhizobium sp. BK251]TCL67175.1 hypothetical protein EV286_11076 [Rhizobium sp. BK251]